MDWTHWTDWNHWLAQVDERVAMVVIVALIAALVVGAWMLMRPSRRVVGDETREPRPDMRERPGVPLEVRTE